MTEEIIINDYVCWNCGQVFSSKLAKTTHHAIPINFKPFKNVLIPICEECHDKINIENFQGLVGYACKLNSNMITLTREVNKLNKFLEENSKFTIKDILKEKEAKQ